MDNTPKQITSDKAHILEELKTEPLKHVLEIADVTNAEKLVDKLSQFETKAGFEKVFSRLKNISALKKY